MTIVRRNDDDWLIVEDNGIGMSELVLTGPLLDFGTSFWRSPLVMEEFPGLVASGMQAIGRFGIGFFSVFMLGSIVRVISRRCDKGDESARVLEIRGGPAGRPILSQVQQGESPLDGGTRVEVCLKTPAHSEKGFLWNGKYAKNRLSFARVVAALAPSLDVGIASADDENVRLVVQANDWLSIADEELLERLDYEHDGDKHAASRSSLMRPLRSANGQIFGRATIAPTRYRTSAVGWVTIAGLRANPLSNVDGILAGEAVTAARDSAVPIVPSNVLAAWATEQAELLLKSRLDDETKSKAAEIVLECGGDIGGLPIARWAGDWLNAQDLAQKCADEEELILNFDGDFTYDEDEDEMHPRDFRNDFEESPNIIMITNHDGSIVRIRGNSWPSSLFEERSGTNRLSEFVREIVRRCWPTGFDEREEKRVVGIAAGYQVERTVVILTKLDPLDSAERD